MGLLQGDGLDCPEELVLRVLSGLLSEHIRSMFKVLWQASQSRLPLHLVREGREEQKHYEILPRSQKVMYLIMNMNELRATYVDKNLMLINRGKLFKLPENTI